MSPGVRYCAMVSLSAARSGDAREHELHAALAERRLADDHGAVVVLERAGDDLAGARRGAVDQDHDRVVGLGAVARRALLLAALGAADGGDDRAALQELVGDLRRLLEQAAGVAAQVEHQALERASFLQLGERLVQLVARARLELLEADVADARLERAVLDRLDADLLARELEGARALPAVGAVAMHPDRDLGARLAAQALHRVVERHVERRLVVDLDDAIEPLEAARPAGVPGIGRMTVSCWSRIEITMPRPPNWPDVDRFISL